MKSTINATSAISVTGVSTITTNSTSVSTITTTNAISATSSTLIPNTTTFAELIAILNRSPAVVKAARLEAEFHREEVYEAELRKIMGDSYEAPIEKKRRRPGAIQLREKATMIAEIAICKKGVCQVFSNGYAIFDNGQRKTVLWVLDCKTSTYYFTELTEAEKQYQKDRDHHGEAETGAMLWYEALMIRGEDRIENNSRFPVSIGTCSDFEEDDEVVKPEPNWYCAVHIDGPEEEYLKKEEREEAFAAMTEVQREAFVLFEKGYKQREISEMLGIGRTSVQDRLDGAKAKYREVHMR